MMITVQDFTGVYAEQAFMQELRTAAETSKDFRWLDCTKIVGTDCYCDDDAIKEINELIDNAECDIENRGNSTSAPAIHFFDNGNYHYMSKLWTDRVQEPFTLIVFDHHPDMQPPRFGGILSCGAWVKEVLDNNKFIQSIIIIGVKDELVETVREELSQSGEANILEKVTFIKESELSTLPSQTSLSSFLSRLSSQHSLYISIDKDALSPTYAATNWDQGSLTLDALKNCITTLASGRKILGIDICGERAHDFEGDEHHTVQEADSLNSELNRELVEFLNNL
ncbi:arginase family protein [Fibrobacter succinogenes]|uniref:Arginase family protein n=1 Tax=Fibrobacter succinogenes TaxID=833 RepID=A0A380RVT2_FIBSU|nr:arginase family protein [Fibrobacter succinogenes]PWJ37379.1 arginase family protein [Fibrobacter succinogenes subsp. elongatus]SUQ19626.1 Arginase family protein [Fibrobacter succinogenes]